MTTTKTAAASFTDVVYKSGFFFDRVDYYWWAGQDGGVAAAINRDETVQACMSVATVHGFSVVLPTFGPKFFR